MKQSFEIHKLCGALVASVKITSLHCIGVIAKTFAKAKKVDISDILYKGLLEINYENALNSATSC